MTFLELSNNFDSVIVPCVDFKYLGDKDIFLKAFLVQYNVTNQLSKEDRIIAICKELNAIQLVNLGFRYSGDLVALVTVLLAFYSKEAALPQVTESAELVKVNKEQDLITQEAIEIILPVFHTDATNCIKQILKNTDLFYRLNIIGKKEVLDRLLYTNDNRITVIIDEKELYPSLAFFKGMKEVISRYRQKGKLPCIVLIQENQIVKQGWLESLVEKLQSDDNIAISTFSNNAPKEAEIREVLFNTVAIKGEAIRVVGCIDPNFCYAFYDTAYCMRFHCFGYKIGLVSDSLVDNISIIETNEEKRKKDESVIVDRDRFKKQCSSVGWLPIRPEFQTFLNGKEEKIAELPKYSGEMIKITLPLFIPDYPNVDNVYFYQDKKIFDSDNKDFISWFKQIESVLSYCKGIGLDVGSGGRTIHRNMYRVDKRDSVAPHIVWDAQTLPMFEDNSADFVFSNQSIEHIENTLLAIQEWLRVVKVGGYVNIITIDEDAYGAAGSEGTDLDHKHCWKKAIFWDMINQWISNKEISAVIEKKVDLGSDYGIVLKKV